MLKIDITDRDVTTASTSPLHALRTRESAVTLPGQGAGRTLTLAPPRTGGRGRPATA